MKKEVIEKISTLLIAAFGLVAALAWNGTIQAIFKELFGTQDTWLAMLTYATIITIIAVFVTIILGKLAAKIAKKEEKK